MTKRRGLAGADTTSQPYMLAERIRVACAACGRIDYLLPEEASLLGHQSTVVIALQARDIRDLIGGYFRADSQEDRLFGRTNKVPCHLIEIQPTVIIIPKYFLHFLSTCSFASYGPLGDVKSSSLA